MNQDIFKKNKPVQSATEFLTQVCEDRSTKDGPCLDTGQLACMELSFRHWVDATSRHNVRHSRRRILLVFLLIRYTGAKLSEILRLNPFTDIVEQTVCIRTPETEGTCCRNISIAAALGQEIREHLADPDFRQSLGNLFEIDPAFVRRKFYERAGVCGFPKHLGGPEMIRRARAVELVRGNMPLPAVQQLLGHSSPNLTAAHVSYSGEELQRVAKLFVERESSRKTSARNAFFGKIETIEQGDIQVRITLINPGGLRVASIITRESMDRLGLQPGKMVTAEVKAPWIILESGKTRAACSADNRFQGTITRINRGQVNSEYVVRIDDGTELCALASTSSTTGLALKVGDGVGVLFTGFAVVLHADD